MPRSLALSLAIHGVLIGLAIFVARLTPLGLGARVGEHVSVLGNFEPGQREGKAREEEQPRRAERGVTEVVSGGRPNAPTTDISTANHAPGTPAQAASHADATASPGVAGANTNSTGGSPAGPTSAMALTIRPHYPRASRAMGEEGAVTLHARFFPDGRASEVRLVKSSGYRRLDESAIEAAQISSASFSARPEAPVEKDFTVVFRLSDPE